MTAVIYTFLYIPKKNQKKRKNDYPFVFIFQIRSSRLRGPRVQTEAQRSKTVKGNRRRSYEQSTTEARKNWRRTGCLAWFEWFSEHNQIFSFILDSSENFLSFLHWLFKLFLSSRAAARASVSSENVLELLTAIVKLSKRFKRQIPKGGIPGRLGVPPCCARCIVKGGIFHEQPSHCIVQDGKKNCKHCALMKAKCLPVRISPDHNPIFDLTAIGPGSLLAWG